MSGSGDPKPENKFRHKLTPADAREIIRLRSGRGGKSTPGDDPASLKSLAERFGVSKACISRIASGVDWRSVREDLGAVTTNELLGELAKDEEKAG